MPTPREQMILTAMSLFQQEGYRATSWRKLVQASGAPWGSAHHYFPGGKEQLGAEAVEVAARDVSSLIAHAFRGGRTAAEGVRTLFSASGALLEKSGFRAGCPVTTVALETTPDSRVMGAACKAAFERWREDLAGALEQGGITADRASALAPSILALFEGALVLARVSQSTEPMRIAGETAATLVTSDRHAPGN